MRGQERRGLCAERVPMRMGAPPPPPRMPPPPSSGVSGGFEVGCVGHHIDMLFVGDPLREQGPLHVSTGGGWKTMVAGGADHD